MDLKLFVAFLIAINGYCSCGAALRRTPKVYNALITTDDNLTSSRAYPVIQPTIHESGLARYPFGPYNPYDLYSSPFVQFGRPIVPGLAPREQLSYHLSNGRIIPQLPAVQSGSKIDGAATTSDSAQPQENKAAGEILPSSSEKVPPVETPQYLPPMPENPSIQMPNEKAPIPINEFGLPPALIPLHHQYGGHPMKLPPYGFAQYPLVYDPITGAQEQYLPPYPFFPSSHTFAIRGGGPPHPPTGVKTEEPDKASPPPAETLPAADNLEQIKNKSKSKNVDVPDVPPPPIPSGAKSTATATTTTTTQS